MQRETVREPSITNRESSAHPPISTTPGQIIIPSTQQSLANDFNQIAFIEGIVKAGGKKRHLKEMFRSKALKLYAEQKSHFNSYAKHNIRRKKITIAQIQEAAENQIPLKDLVQIYKPRFFANVMNIIANKHPELFAHYYGQPESNKRLLIDECVCPPLTPIIHQFGKVNDVYHINKAGTKDPDLFPMAAELGYTAIFTVDAAKKKDHDMVNVAKKHYQERTLDSPPGLIIFPHQRKKGIARIKERQDAIRDYLAQDTYDHVLNLC